MTDPTSSFVEYTPPDTLPPPMHQPEQTYPTLALPLGIVSAIAGGVALFFLSRLVYIYVLYNSLIGIAIGLAISSTVEAKNYQKSTFLFSVTAISSLIVYLVFNLLLMGAVQTASRVDFSFIEFIQFRAENDTFIRGARLGSIGNYIVWLVELFITLYYAYEKVYKKIQMLEIKSIPSEVIDFILYALNNDYEADRIRTELFSRGWERSEDQDRAFVAVSALASLVRENEENKTKSN